MIFPAVLESFLKRHANHTPSETPIAVFDCDGTVIKGDIGEAMLYYQIEHFLFKKSPAELWPDYPRRADLHELYEKLLTEAPDKHRENPLFDTFAGMMLSWYFDQLAEKKTTKACADIVRLFGGFTATELNSVAEESLRRELSLPVGFRTIGRHHVPQGIRFIQESIGMIQQLKKLGFDVWAVSGSNQWSVEAVFRRLDVPANHVIGSGLEERDGVFSSTVRTPFPVLEGKVGALQRHVTYPPVFVASDSVYDIPLLEYSKELKVLVNSRNGASANFFQEGGIVNDSTWAIIESPTTAG